ncbi:hypothetical protein Q0Z83_023210 [Actinoplanes sichuanensis]|uniref:Transposase n=1 Tax=Actinoplanes sichuanensis TaxID=512349 RepID=A0ABW4A178_9ACTN|nr:hypothetical protein [Actinoplanes sichuanensis]BEL04130.1 hypothetical protein Q0Z83_023210 [Actinoplanes sichuanensis]
MSRKPPGSVRAELPRRRKPGTRIAVIDGVSAKGLRALARLERTRLGPSGAWIALKGWEGFARADDDERADQIYYGEVGCCPDPRDNREILDRVLHALPARDAKVLRKRIQALDDRIGSLDDGARP